MATLCCSFCGAEEGYRAKLIIGPAVNICNECVAMCVHICIGKEEDKEHLKWKVLEAEYSRRKAVVVEKVRRRTLYLTHGQIEDKLNELEERLAKIEAGDQGNLP